MSRECVFENVGTVFFSVLRFSVKTSEIVRSELPLNCSAVNVSLHF